MDTLLNWIWQGSVVALLLSAVLGLCRGASASARYGVSATAFLIVLLLPFFPSIPAVIPAELSVNAESASLPRWMPVVSAGQLPYFNATVLVVWACWVAGFCFRASAACIAVRRARASSVSFPVARELRLEHWMILRASGRRARLVVSDRVQYAAVLGCVSPVIAVAPALLAHLEDDELDRVVIHEWSHVQRYDDVSHIVQLLIRVVLGWHPAIWWIGRQLHAEREAACDEVAIRVTGSAKTYARCLAKLAGLPLLAVPTLPAPRALSSSDVGSRVVRVLRLETGASDKHFRIATMAAAVVVSVLGFMLASIDFAIPLAAAAPEFATAVSQAPSSPRLDPRASTATIPGQVIRPDTYRSAPTRGRSLTRFRVPTRSVPDVTVDVVRPIPVDVRSSGSEPAATPPSLVVQQALLTGVGVVLPDLISPPPVPASAAEPGRSFSRWNAAGMAVGRGSQTAAVATAGFFNKAGRKIAGAF